MFKRTVILVLALALAALPCAFAEYLDPYQKGDKVEDMSVELINGETFTLSEHLGKVVLIDVWATWCPFCVQRSLPALERIAEEYPDDVVVLTVESGEKEQDVIDFIVRNGYEFATFADENFEFDFSRFYAESLPTCFFIDAQGYYYGVHVGGGEDVYDTYKSMVDEMLALRDDAA